jgi:hypothetical protein
VSVIAVMDYLESSVLMCFGSLVQPYGRSNEERDGSVIEGPGSWFSAMRVFISLACIFLLGDGVDQGCWRALLPELLEDWRARVTRPGLLFADRMPISFLHGIGL